MAASKESPLTRATAIVEAILVREPMDDGTLRVDVSEMRSLQNLLSQIEVKSKR